jgi:O-antigen ligase
VAPLVTSWPHGRASSGDRSTRDTTAGPGVRVRASAVPSTQAVRLAATWLAAFVFAVAAGIFVGSSPSLNLILPATILLCGWAGSWMVGRAAAYAVAFSVLVAVALPDLLANVLSPQVVVVLLVVNLAALLVATGLRGPIRREDVGLLFLLVAILWPLLVSGSFDKLPGALGIVVIYYMTGRARGVSLKSLVVLLLIAGAVQGIVAIAQSFPAISSLGPFQALQSVVPFLPGRATGLFNNPNTLGVVEAIILVIAILVGPPRWTLPLVALCAAGLILSVSREALFGLIVGLILIGVQQFRGRAPWLLVVLIAGAVVLWVFPSSHETFDPSGYGTDADLVRRFDLWRAGLDLVARSPFFGYGTDLFATGTVTDNAYVGWMVSGGLTGLLLWMIGVIGVTPRRLFPVLAAMLAISTLGNAFAGPSLAVFLAICGAVVTEEARERSAIRDTPRSRRHWEDTRRASDTSMA